MMNPPIPSLPTSGLPMLGPGSVMVRRRFWIVTAFYFWPGRVI